MLDSAIPSTNKCAISRSAKKLLPLIACPSDKQKSSSHQCKQTLDTAYPLPHLLRIFFALDHLALCSSS
ncbi:hypothetical protein E4U39_007916 [Claviceps sp. Clav50 group G5]|nr:hypothetical protein E4U39_007916 [Claviceps sp. Clav50 group G5]